VVQLDLGVKNAQFAGLLWAERAGWYRDAGLSVSIEAALPGVDVARRVAENSNVVGSIESGLMITARSEGMPVVAIGTMFQASPLCLISFKDQGIRRPEDLVGKRVAIHGDGHEALDTVLGQAGLGRDRLTVVEADYGNGPLLRREVDAKQGYQIDEFVALETAGHPVVALSLREFGHRAYSQVYFVSENFLKTNRAALVRFLEVSNRGWRAALADVPGAARMIVEQHAPDLALAYQERSLREIAALVTAESPRMATMQPATWEANRASFLRTRPSSSVGPVDDWVDFTLAEEANRIAASATGSVSDTAIVPVYGKINPQRRLLTDAEVLLALRGLPGWRLEDGKLRKTFVRKNFSEAVALIESIVPVCDELDHHPEIFTVYNKVNLALVSYDAGNRISSTDLLLAERIESRLGSGTGAAEKP